MNTDEIDKKIAKIEEEVEKHRALFLDSENRNLEYADIKWLIGQLKAWREEALNRSQATKKECIKALELLTDGWQDCYLHIDIIKQTIEEVYCA